MAIRSEGFANNELVKHTKGNSKKDRIMDERKPLPPEDKDVEYGNPDDPSTWVVLDN